MIRPDELIIDNFAGGGGASTGIEMALGRPVDVAINHDPEAVAMHQANHPHTLHYCQSVWKADPRDVVMAASRRRGSDAPLPVGLAWFSPDCKHFSKAKGGRPVENHIRDLAWVVVHWAKLVKPRVIMLENVEEFRTWAPLRVRKWPNGTDMFDLHGNAVLEPDPARAGQTFWRWIRQLRSHGYTDIQWREVRAMTSDAPTIRKRLIIKAVRAGEKVRWAKPTHGPAKGLKPYRTAAECIDWSLPCPSIFLTKEEARKVGAKRPLVENTERRIAAGTRRFVLQAAKPFIIPITHAGDSRTHDIDEPMRTQTTANRGEHALIVPTFVGCGGRAGQSRPRSGDEPFATATAKPDTCVVAAHITKFRSNAIGSDMTEPMPTVTANSFIKRPGGSAPVGLVTAYLAQHNTGVIGRAANEPLSTVTKAGAQQQIVTSHLVKLRNNQDGQSVETPMPTLTSGGGHVGEIRCFLVKYYGSGGQDQAVTEPMHTLTAKPRMGLVQAELVEVQTDLPDDLRYAAWWVARFLEKYDPEPKPLIVGPRASAVGTGGYVLTDIGMRMLTPRERFRAQGFPDSYIIDPIYNGKPLSETAQGRMCGNSVCPDMAAAEVAAQFGPIELAEVA